METCGLSTMEAALMGCNVVITDKGDAREYYKDFACYCDHGSVESIRNALLRAYEKPADPLLREYILSNFSWEKTAGLTLSAYRSLVNNA
jgi:glycosyltransferase involved in cell wall biosynthesis